MAGGKLGRPPLPQGERKRTITVYLGTTTVERIEQQALRSGLSRNQVIAGVLARYFGEGSKGDAEQPASVEAAGPEPRALRTVRGLHYAREILGGLR
jgi:hypothetical protein